MTADYADGANIIDVQSAAVFKKILQENPHVNVIFYTGDWEQSYKDAFSYQYRCYSILYPRMKFCRVRKDCFEVTDNILLKFGFHPEEHIETTGAWGIKEGRKDSETGNNRMYSPIRPQIHEFSLCAGSSGGHGQECLATPSSHRHTDLYTSAFAMSSQWSISLQTSLVSRRL
ncbi:hypothetical protein H072_7576 [Dactylellina haptotyla CBS 200.50]|uniref:Uncharacterized protein n=1 Tax=Dactylellina haptotyla (strain CBS 200.50) TaxID=1284197 RepID=S8BTN5_DACHA|nr:hypothetical protein H072_7576 [Dactylellina haptotyla CBS 200.50]